MVDAAQNNGDGVQAVLDRLDKLLSRETSPQRFLSIQNAAGYCDLSAESIRRLIDRGKLIARRPVKGKVLIDRHELDRLILGSTDQPTSGRGRAR